MTGSRYLTIEFHFRAIKTVKIGTFSIDLIWLQQFRGRPQITSRNFEQLLTPSPYRHTF